MNSDLIFLALSLFTWGLGESMFLFFQPLYLQQLGASPISIGVILGAWAVAMAITHIPAGYLSDRLGSRPIIWAAWFSGLIAAFIMAIAQTLPVFVAGLLFYGLGAFVMAPLNSYVTSARGRWSVGRALTLISASYNLGAIIGPTIGGLIGDRIGLHPIYFISAGLFVISNITILFIRPQAAAHLSSIKGKKSFPISQPYLNYLAVIFFAMFVTYIPQPLSANYLQNQHGLTYGHIGQLGSVGSTGVVLLNLILGQLNARVGFLIGQVSVAAFSLLLWKGTSLPWFALGYFLLGGYRAARSLATSQTQGLVSPSQLGLAYGVTEFVNSSATILAPLLAGVLYQHNPEWMYSSSLVLILLSFLISFRFSPNIKEIKPQPAGLIDKIDGT